MKRKRIEAWAVTSDDYAPAAHLYRTKKLATQDRFVGERVVRLVEYDAAKEAVVRAAVLWTHLALDRSSSGSPGRADAYDNLVRAVEKYQRRKR